MNCPRCGGGLSTIQYEGAQIETCPGCGGEWLDAEELKKIVHTVEQRFSPQEIASVDAVNQNIFTIDESPENELVCPKCAGVELNRFNYASSTGIALDKCPVCEGIWLDKGELEKVQVLVEEWQKKFEEDLETYGPTLVKIRKETDKEMGQAAGVARVGFVNAVLRGLMWPFRA